MLKIFFSQSQHIEVDDWGEIIWRERQETLAAVEEELWSFAVKNNRPFKHSSSVNAKDCSGFTLIEVLVALVFIGLALPALTLRVQTILDHTSYMEEKSYSYWIAQNRMEQYLIEKRIEDAKRAAVVPQPGNAQQAAAQAQAAAASRGSQKKVLNETLEYNGLDWFLRIEREETAADETYYIHVSVGRTEGNWSATLTRLIYDA